MLKHDHLVVFIVKLEKLKSQLNAYGFIEIEEAVTGGLKVV